MNLMTTVQPGNRIATADEQFHALHALLSLGESATAKLLELAGKLDNAAHLPLVVTDFSNVGEHTILLVPEGVHRVPRAVLAAHCYLIGLPGRVPPTLLLEGESDQPVFNVDTSQTTKLAVFESSCCKFAHLRLDVAQPSVLELCLTRPNQFFSDRLFQVECSAHVDVLDIAGFAFLNGHSWALGAYGEKTYGVRSNLERALDGFHEGVIKGIDGIFRPLVAAGEKIDAFMGWGRS